MASTETTSTATASRPHPVHFEEGGCSSNFANTDDLHPSLRARLVIPDSFVHSADTALREQRLADSIAGLSRQGERPSSAIAQGENGPRCRLSSIDPNDLYREIVRLQAEQHMFCRHLHICIQAVSDLMLKRMDCRYRTECVRELLGDIEQKLLKCCIGSDLITGFPGESRAELDQEIKDFLGLPLSYLHVFPYSDRTGTGAVTLDGSVPGV